MFESFKLKIKINLLSMDYSGSMKMWNRLNDTANDVDDLMGLKALLSELEVIEEILGMWWRNFTLS